MIEALVTLVEVYKAECLNLFRRPVDLWVEPVGHRWNRGG